MRFKWAILFLSLVLLVNTADFDTSMGNKNSVDIADEKVLAKSYRFKRQCCCCDSSPALIVACCSGVAGQKEMFRNYWLHILLMFLTSMSWMKAMIY
ncbi:1-deoxy-D-xylulose 5-phosphate reductoisomerase [Dirofilaria immitis]